MPEECLKKMQEFFHSRGIKTEVIAPNEKIKQDDSFVATLRPTLEKIMIN